MAAPHEDPKLGPYRVPGRVEAPPPGPRDVDDTTSIVLAIGLIFVATTSRSIYAFVHDGGLHGDAVYAFFVAFFSGLCIFRAIASAVRGRRPARRPPSDHEP